LKSVSTGAISFDLKIILSLLFIIALYSYSFQAFPLAVESSVVKNSSWISERDNLNISLRLEPQIPLIDEITKLFFEVRNLSDSTPINNLNTKVTITDHDGRLFKFENKLIPISDGHFSISYIFPDDGEHRIILQLYKNTTGFAVGSFDLTIPHAVPPSESDKLVNSLIDFLDSIF